jgi:glutaconyl-CoA/methylmalonyl-CoA decarboxylase subunit delta
MNCMTNLISFDFSAISGFSVMVAVVGYLTVFVVLVFLYFIYFNIPKLIRLNVKQKLRKQGKLEDAERSVEIVGEVNAAIAAALYLFLNEHDEESHRLTIKNIQRSYTPWSSRIYNVNDYFKMK